jgi:hypothetical protein
MDREALFRLLTSKMDLDIIDLREIYADNFGFTYLI